jgi:hypothetical protein
VTAHQILAHAGFADVDAQLQQLAVNPRSDPSGFSRLMVRINWRTSFGTAGRLGLPWSDLPGPEQAKAFPVPADDGGGFDDKDTGLPVVPDGT